MRVLRDPAAASVGDFNWNVYRVTNPLIAFSPHAPAPPAAPPSPPVPPHVPPTPPAPYGVTYCTDCDGGELCGLCLKAIPWWQCPEQLTNQLKSTHCVPGVGGSGVEAGGLCEADPDTWGTCSAAPFAEINNCGGALDVYRRVDCVWPSPRPSPPPPPLPTTPPPPSPPTAPSEELGAEADEPVMNMVIPLVAALAVFVVVLLLILRIRLDARATMRRRELLQLREMAMDDAIAFDVTSATTDKI